MLAWCENRQPRRMRRHAEDLGKGAADEEIGHALDFGEGGDAGEFVVGLVDQHGGLARAMQNALDAEQRDAGAGGIVGVGEEDGAGVRRDGVEHFLEGELHAGQRVGDLPDVRAGDFGVEAVHGVGRPEDEHFLAVVDVGVEEDLDGLVGAVGEDELLGRDVEIGGDGLLGFAVFGIDGEAAGGESDLRMASMTRGEQPTVFSLKSRRSLPARPAVGGE